jgi:small-conductance mechanosensitive channel
MKDCEMDRRYPVRTYISAACLAVGIIVALVGIFTSLPGSTGLVLTAVALLLLLLGFALSLSVILSRKPKS